MHKIGIHFFCMVDIAGFKNVEYVHVQLQKMHQEYWKQLNTTFGHLGQLLPMILFSNSKFTAIFMANNLNQELHLILAYDHY